MVGAPACLPGELFLSRLRQMLEQPHRGPACSTVYLNLVADDRHDREPAAVVGEAVRQGSPRGPPKGAAVLHRDCGERRSKAYLQGNRVAVAGAAVQYGVRHRL